MCYSEGLDICQGVSDLALARDHEGTRFNQGSRIVYITEKHTKKHAQSTTFRLLVEASLFRLTGSFHIHLFFLFI